MAAITQNSQEVPVKIVGSSMFGRYQTISSERTYNMFISQSGDKQEEWLVNFPGYDASVELLATGQEGRGGFHSVRGGFIIAVVSENVYKINDALDAQIIGTLLTTEGEVFIDENLSSQISIVDGSNVYIYNHETDDFAIGTLTNPPGGSFDPADLVPNYVTYQNTYFIFGNALTTNAGSQWFVFQKGAGNTELDWVQTLTLQTKPDFAKAALRIPGKGNNILVLGSTVAEIWTNVGGVQVYQRNSSVNIDYGCISVATIAASDEIVAWLAINENSTPAIMVMSGGGAQLLSTDGINHLLQNIQFPSESTALLYRQDGHLFYQLTFFNEVDNLTIIYDFTTNRFFDLTDWDFSYHPARQIVFYNNKTYFISIKNGFLYETSSDITYYGQNANVDDIKAIPRVRVCDTFRLQRPEKFRVNLFTFVIESGTTPNAYNYQVCNGFILTQDTNVPILTEITDVPILVEGAYCTTGKPKVAVTISKNGGITFSNAVDYTLKATGQYRNQPRFSRLGVCSQLTIQMRFWGLGRFVVKNGVIEVSQ